MKGLSDVKRDDAKHSLSKDDQAKIRTIMAQLEREAQASVERGDGPTRAAPQLRRRLIALTAVGVGMVLFLAVGVIAREFAQGPRRVLPAVPSAPPAPVASRGPEASRAPEASQAPEASRPPEAPRESGGASESSPAAAPVPPPTAAAPVPEPSPTVAAPTEPAGPSMETTQTPSSEVSPRSPEPPAAGQASSPTRRRTRSTSERGTRPTPPASREPARRQLAAAPETWILWAQEEGREAQIHGWQVKAVLSAQSACDQAMRDEIRRAKNAFVTAHGAGYTVGDTHGRAGWGGFHESKGATYVDFGVTYRCLPGTDPRAPRES
jgi:cytoskeletal protein RodZ